MATTTERGDRSVAITTDQPARWRISSAQVINLRGTSSAGKRTLARSIMAAYSRQEPVYRPGRRRPVAVACRSDGRCPLAVLGHYDTACGGCDTSARLDDVFAALRQWKNDFR